MYLYYIDGLHVFCIGFMIMMCGFALVMSNVGTEVMQNDLKDSAWQHYTSYRDYIWWAGGACGLGGFALLAASFKIESHGGP